MQATLIKTPEETEKAVDTIICPHCGSQMIRNKMDNPYTIHGRSYICQVCGAEEIVSPNTEEEIC